MSKVDLQQDIRKNGGFILSDGTLNLEHLLPKAHDVIYNYKLGKCKQLLKDIRSCFVHLDTPLLSPAVHFGYISLKEDQETQETANYLWNEDVFHFLNNLAPDGYYFGSSDGDGACIGWFKYEEESV